MNLAETPPAAAHPVLQASVVQIEAVGRRKLAGSPPAFMTFDGFCRLVGTLAPPVELHLHGDGEPLLHPRFFDMVAYASARGIDVSASTRLPGLTARRAEECVRSGLRRLRVLAGGAPSPLAARSLARLAEAKLRLGSKLPEVELDAEGLPPATPALRYTFSGQPVSTRT